MDERQETVRNSAEGSASVGIQAQTVHNSTVYQVLPDTPPHEKYQVGVRYLEDGVPVKARELINEAIAHGYESNEVRFHWLLAMLSKRSYRQLSREERAQIGDVRGAGMPDTSDDSVRGAQVVYGLLDCHERAGTDPGQALKELDALDVDLRRVIVRHLALILTGSMKDKLWADTYEAAERTQLASGRLDRVWAYFHPTPVGARALEPQPASTTEWDSFVAVSITALFAIAASYLGWVLLVGGEMNAILAYVIACAAGCLVVRVGSQWRHRQERLNAKDREHLNDHRLLQPPSGGFADRVDRMFDHYFWRYAPRDTDRETWLSETQGIRDSMRDEVTTLYREKRVNDRQISWLVRFLVTDVRRRWSLGTLLEYRDRHRVGIWMKVVCCLGFTTLAVTGAYIAITVVLSQALMGTLAVTVCGFAGLSASRRWLTIHVEKLRHADEYSRWQQDLDARRAAHLRWKNKLADARPSEEEMETWLECDRTMLLDKAMKHYQLAWREVIAYAFLQTRPSKGYDRARDPHGPWRYSRYMLRLYLLTADGVREMETDLDFKTAHFTGEKRASFRFDAVASVRVDNSSDSAQTLELLLVNGPAQNIRITDEAPQAFQSDEDSPAAARLTLDAAGFGYALHILEGIAAEGKHWIHWQSDQYHSA